MRKTIEEHLIETRAFLIKLRAFMERVRFEKRDRVRAAEKAAKKKAKEAL